MTDISTKFAFALAIVRQVSQYCILFSLILTAPALSMFIDCNLIVCTNTTSITVNKKCFVFSTTIYNFGVLDNRRFGRMANELRLRNEDISEVLLHIELKNLKNFEQFESKEFFVRGNPWYLIFKKDIDGGKDSLGIHLYSNVKNLSSKSFIVAVFEATLLPRKLDVEAVCMNTTPNLFSSKFFGWGSFISWETLVNPENGFVMDDKCKLEIRVKASPLNECTKIEPIDSCDKCLQRKFRMKINDIYEFFGVRLSEIVLDDCSFYVTAFRNKNNLDLKITKKGMKVCSVSFLFKLISYDANVKPMMVRVNNRKFIANVFTSIAHTLATWQQLIDPAKKFIQNDSFVIEVDLKIDTNKPKSKKCRTCSESNGAVFLSCPICFENLKLVPAISTITTCGHMFCSLCAAESVKKNGKCPSCNTAASLKSLIRTYLPTE